VVDRAHAAQRSRSRSSTLLTSSSRTIAS
jgi:hypothetical protein